MNFTDWIPAITSSSLLAVGGFIAAWVGQPWINRFIQSRFDASLEQTKTRFRREEEKLRSDLQTLEREQNSLRDGALNSLSTRHAAIDNRRLQAVERIWGSVVAKSHLKLLCTMAQVVKMDRLIEGASKGGVDADGIARFAEVMFPAAKLDKPTQEKTVETERPFVSENVWALYSAYNLVVSYPSIQLMLVKHRLDAGLLKEPGPLLDMVKKVLPHQGNFIDKRGVSALNFLVDEIEQKLLSALRDSLDGKESDLKGVQQANEIIRLAGAISQAEAQAVQIPDELKGGSTAF